MGPRHRVFGSQVAKRHTRPNRDARCRVDAAHDGVHIVARSVEAVNRNALCIEHARIAIGDQTCGGTNVARVKGHGIKGAFAQSAQAGVGAMPCGVAVGALVVGGAALEIFVNAFVSQRI